MEVVKRTREKLTQTWRGVVAMWRFSGRRSLVRPLPVHFRARRTFFKFGDNNKPDDLLSVFLSDSKLGGDKKKEDKRGMDDKGQSAKKGLDYEEELDIISSAFTMSRNKDVFPKEKIIKPRTEVVNRNQEIENIIAAFKEPSKPVVVASPKKEEETRREQTLEEILQAHPEMLQGLKDPAFRTKVEHIIGSNQHRLAQLKVFRSR